MHKRLILGIGVLSVFTLVAIQSLSSVLTASLDDVDRTSYEGQAALFLEKRDIIDGFPDGTFRGYLSVNRVQAAKMLLLAGGRDVNLIATGGAQAFPDLSQGEWYEQYVLNALRYGIMQGYPDGTFGPENPINRAEFLKMVTLTFDLEKHLEYHYTDVPDNVWFAQYTGAAEKYNLFLYDTDVLKPSEAMTRNEVAWALYQVLIYKEKDIIIRTPSDFTPTTVAIQPQVLSESSFSAPVEDVKPAAPDVPTIAPAVPLAPINCTDTDATASFPLGINQNEAGAVSIPDGLGGNAIFADFCLEGLGPNVLLEYYCSDLGALTSEKLNCPGICDSGACSIENIDPNATDPRRPTGTLDVPASSSSSQGTGGAPVPAPAPVAPVPAPVAPAPAPTVASPPPPPPPPPPPAVTTNSTLFITQKSNGLAGTATLGEQDVTLLAFEAVGGNEAINIIQTSFSAISGVESARNVNNYSLWADTNNDGAVDLKLQGNVQVNNAGVIAFSQLGNGGVGFTVGSSLAIRLEVHGNIGDTIRTANLQLQFALESQVSSSIQSHTQTAFLSGVQRNGSCPQSQCNTFLSTVEAKTFTITDGGSTPPPPPSAPQVTGSLEVRQDPTPFRNQFLLGGALSEPVFQLELTARTNPIALREIQIFDQSNDGGRSIDELGVFLAGQSQMIGYATRQSCPQIPTVLTNALFCLVLNNNELVLQPGVKTDLIFRAGVRMENQGGLYGDRVQLSVSPFTGAARAYDITANADLSQNDGDGINEGEIFIGDVTNNGQNRIIIGKEFDVSMSELASITNGSIDANGSFVPNSVSPLGTFTFTAKPNLNFNEVAISSLLFTVNATNVSIDKNSLKLYNVNSPLRMNCEAVGPGDTAISGPSLPQLSYVYCINIEQTDLVNDIRSGENIVLALEGDITDSNNSLNFSTSTLQVSLEHIDDRSTNFGLSPHSSLIWLDQDQPRVYKTFYHMNSVDSSVESTRYES